MTTIAYTLFRDSVSNEEIVQLNDVIVQSASELGISVIDLNEVVEKRRCLTISIPMMDCISIRLDKSV